MDDTEKRINWLMLSNGLNEINERCFAFGQVDFSLILTLSYGYGIRGSSLGLVG